MWPPDVRETLQPSDTANSTSWRRLSRAPRKKLRIGGLLQVQQPALQILLFRRQRVGFGGIQESLSKVVELSIKCRTSTSLFVVGRAQHADLGLQLVQLQRLANPNSTEFGGNWTVVGADARFPGQAARIELVLALHIPAASPRPLLAAVGTGPLAAAVGVVAATDTDPVRAFAQLELQLELGSAYPLQGAEGRYLSHGRPPQ